MFFKLTICALVFGIATADFYRNSFARSADFNLVQFLARNSENSQRNPERSLACFNHYLPLLNELTAKYEADYAACLHQAEEARQQVDSSTKPEREEIEGSANNACDLLTSCNSNENSISYFECYNSAGSENTKAMYSISLNASDALTRVREAYRLVENNQYQCTNASERAYVQNSAATYEELQSCLQGKTAVPTTPPPTESTPSTVEPPNTEPSTASPSTPAPSSPEPETSSSTASSPEPSTAASSTPAPTSPEPETSSSTASSQPSTDAPSTPAPTSPEPETSSSTASSPEPSTEAPSTPAPTSPEPESSSSTASSPEPSTEAPSTPEQPETSSQEPPSTETSTAEPESTSSQPQVFKNSA